MKIYLVFLLVVCAILAGCVDGGEEGGGIVDPLDKEGNKISGWLAGQKYFNDSTLYSVGIHFSLEPRVFNGVLDGFEPWIVQYNCDGGATITYPNDQLGQDDFWTDGELHKTLKPPVADGDVLIVNWTRDDSLQCRYFKYDSTADAFWDIDKLDICN